MYSVPMNTVRLLYDQWKLRKPKQESGVGTGKNYTEYSVEIFILGKFQILFDFF